MNATDVLRYMRGSLADALTLIVELREEIEDLEARLEAVKGK